MMIAEDTGQSVSGAAVDYLPERYYWVGDSGRKQVAQVVRIKGSLKWSLGGVIKAFVDVVYKGPIEEPG